MWNSLPCKKFRMWCFEMRCFCTLCCFHQCCCYPQLSLSHCLEGTWPRGAAPNPVRQSSGITTVTRPSPCRTSRFDGAGRSRPAHARMAPMPQPAGGGGAPLGTWVQPRQGCRVSWEEGVLSEAWGHLKHITHRDRLVTPKTIESEEVGAAHFGGRLPREVSSRH